MAKYCDKQELCVYVKPVGRDGEGDEHEPVMLPSDSSCSNGTSCYCVIEVKFWVTKRLFWVTKSYFFNLNISTHIYLHHGDYVTAGVCFLNKIIGKLETDFNEIFKKC